MRSSHRHSALLASLLGLLVPLALQAQEAPEPLTLVQQGKRLNTEGKQEEALALYEKALAANPNLFDAHLASGLALDLLGRYTEARTHLARAIELAPPEGKITALNAMAVSFAFEARANEGAQFYQRAFDAEAPERPASAAEEANALGRLYLESGDTKNARRWYQTGFETARRQKDEPASQLDLWQFRWLHAQARIAAREGRHREAVKQAAAARVLMTTSPSLADQKPAVAYLEGYIALYGGKARDALTALASADQQDPFILMLEARASEKLGDRPGADRFWRQVLTVNGHSLQNAFARPAARKAVPRIGPRP